MASNAPHGAPPHSACHSWKVTVTLPDGSRGRHYGVYPNGATAILRAMDLFPSAWSISARRLSPAQPHPHPHHQPHHHPERRA